MRSNSFRSDPDQPEDLADYRPLSVIAIGALLLALPGCLGVFLSTFVVFPALALLLALFSLWRNASAPASANRLTWLAVGVSIFLIAFPATLHYLNARSEIQFAQNGVDHWLELLRGKNPREAYLMTLTNWQRPTDPNAAMPPATRSQRATIMPVTQTEFRDLPEIRMISDPANQLRFMRLAAKLESRPNVDYHFVYEIVHPQIRNKRMFAVLGIRKSTEPDGSAHWQMAHYQVVDQARLN